ncbi:MAG: hypothetical protein LV479_11165 [Methylacidiphilales bacterium]|nr:hypothetical protein [Candidatus Methylacidiphilales bacterium]
MSWSQKIGRVFLLGGTLIIGSIIAAMLGTVVLFLIERGRQFTQAPEFFNGLGILALGFLVNAACVAILIQMKRADNKLIPPRKNI